MNRNPHCSATKTACRNAGPLRQTQPPIPVQLYDLEFAELSTHDLQKERHFQSAIYVI